MESKTEYLTKQTQKITDRINEGFDELNISDIYSDVCEAIKMLNLNYPDLDKIVNLQSVDLTKKEREVKTEALNQAITELKPNKINILLVFGAFDQFISPHSNILIEFDGEFYSMDTMPELNSTIYLLSEYAKNNLFYNGAGQRELAKIQRVQNTCVKKCLSTIDNILQIIKEIGSIENKKFIKNFLRNGLTKQNKQPINEEKYLENNQATKIERFDFNSMQLILETDNNKVLCNLENYLTREKKLLETSKNLEEVREKIKNLPEDEAIDRRLKGYYLQEFAIELEILKKINKQMVELLEDRMDNQSTYDLTSYSSSKCEVINVWSFKELLPLNPKSIELEQPSSKINEEIPYVVDEYSSEYSTSQQDIMSMYSILN